MVRVISCGPAESRSTNAPCSIETPRSVPTRTSPSAPCTETGPSVSPAPEAMVIHLVPAFPWYFSSRRPLTERTSTRSGGPLSVTGAAFCPCTVGRDACDKRSAKSVRAYRHDELPPFGCARSEEHTSELQSPMYLVCRLLLEKKKAETDTVSTTLSPCLRPSTRSTPRLRQANCAVALCRRLPLSKVLFSICVFFFF